VLVHLGDKIPKHVEYCLLNLSYLGFDSYMVVSESAKEDFLKLNLLRSDRLFEYEKLANKKELNYSIKGYPSDFMGGFYNNTIKRFFAVSSLSQKLNFDSFFHIENDVSVRSTMGAVERVLKRSGREVAMVMENENRCVPSIMWFKNSGAAAHFSNQVIEVEGLTDMEAAAQYFQSNRDICLNFPVIPRCGALKSIFGTIDYSNMIEEFNCVFDGAYIGQYLYGIDKFNPSESIKTSGFVNEDFIGDLSSIGFEGNEFPFISCGKGERWPIANLHVHSKHKMGFML